MLSGAPGQARFAGRERMPPPQPDPTSQLLRHLAAARAAGIEWLPRTARIEMPAPPDAVPEPQPSIPAEEATMSEEAAPTADVFELRRRELQVLATTVSTCERCEALFATRTQTVFGVGPLDPDVGFIGEAPGANEDATGEPFVGAAGQLLNRIIAAAGMKREEVYIANILKCRPPGNRRPQADEARNCREYLDRQLELVRPRHLVCLGASAAQYLLGVSTSLGKLRGRFHDYRGMPVVCTYHPSYLLQLEEPAKTERKRDVWEDMKMLLTRMGRPIPGAK
jgi:DNA polymerase